MYSEETIANADAEVQRLSDWKHKHSRPKGLFFLKANGYDVDEVWDGISSDVYRYLTVKDRATWARQQQFASLGHKVWVASCAAEKSRGYRRLYLRQIAKLGGKLLHVLEMRYRNAVLQEQAEAKVREDAERLERQRTPSPWGDAVCAGCGGKKRVWADETNGVCARCQTLL